MPVIRFKDPDTGVDIEIEGTVEEITEAFKKVTRERGIVAHPSNPTPGHIRVKASKRHRLLERIERLVDPQFRKLVERLKLPKHYLPGDNASKTDRAIGVLDLAEQRDPALDELENVLDAITRNAALIRTSLSDVSVALERSSEAADEQPNPLF